MPLQPFLSGHVEILDHGHTQKLSKIETLRLAQNYIKVLSAFVVTHQKLKYDDMEGILAHGLSATTANLLKARLRYDLDCSLAENLIEDGEWPPERAASFDCEQCWTGFRRSTCTSEDPIYLDYVDYDFCYD